MLYVVVGIQPNMTGDPLRRWVPAAREWVSPLLNADPGGT